MTDTNPRDDMAKLSLHLRDCVQKADGNWAYVNIDVLLDASEYLERFAQSEPSSLKEQALQALNDAVEMADDAPPEGIRSDQADTICRALEQLND